MYCDLQGRFLNPEHNQQQFQYKVERAMRLFYRLRYTHHRHMATHDSAIVDLNRKISPSDLSEDVREDASAFGRVQATSGMEGNAAGTVAPIEQCQEHMVVDEDDDRTQVDEEEFRESAGQIDNPDKLYLNLRCDLPCSVKSTVKGKRS
jgi:hypothetical protein